MRLTASGTASVAAAETMSASSAAREHAPMTQEIWPEREQRANRGALAFPTLCRARNRIPPAAVGAVKFWCCELHYRPSEFFQGTDFKSLGPRRKGPFTAPFRRSLVPG